MIQHKHHRLGWIPDHPDHRDHLFVAPPPPAGALPAAVDLRGGCPSVYDQGQLGSCTANAIAAAVQFDRLKQQIPDFMPSRLFLYYNERVIENTVQSDAGGQLRDGIKSLASQGDCPEALWPYLDDGKTFAAQPPQECYDNAVLHTAVAYQRLIQNLNQLKGCLAAGYPFVFGFTVYESFESDAVAQSGQAPMPSLDEPALGGHAVLAVGYDDARNWFIVRNSWGPAWGDQGYFYLPYTYLADENLATDFWTLRIVN
jgi:C1A family cysteine protease